MGKIDLLITKLPRKGTNNLNFMFCLKPYRALLLEMVQTLP